MGNNYIPARGHIIWISFTPQAGREQSGRRPALVLSHESYNQKVELAVMCPITSKVKGYPFEVTLPEELAVEGVVLADQVRSLDWKMRNAEFACVVPDSVVDEVSRIVSVLIL